MKKSLRVLSIMGGSIVLVWILAFSVNSARNCKVGFDFDDTIAFSSPSFDAAAEKYTKRAMNPKDSNYKAFWEEVNGHPELDIPKPTTLFIAKSAKALGCDAVVITARSGIGIDRFIDFWDETFDEIYFADDKARILSRDNYLAFFGDSDSDIEEAEKAGIPGIRIMRHPDSANTRGYNPGQFDEFIVPNSEGPSE